MCEFGGKPLPGIPIINKLIINNYFPKYLNFATHFKTFGIFRPNGWKALKTEYMKKGIHPQNYKFVVFRDMSNGHAFLSRSTAYSKETIKWEDGNEYPLIKLEISNTSHPFFTGKSMLVDTAGRIDKFNKRYEKKAK